MSIMSLSNDDDDGEAWHSEIQDDNTSDKDKDTQIRGEM